VEKLETKEIKVNGFVTKKQEQVIRHFLSFEVVEKNPEGLERTFYVKDRSKGFYWFFNFVMKLEFNDKTLEESSGAIYLLDEPGSYLHPYAQNKLCKKLINLSNDNNVIYCTHTHYLLDPEVIPLNTIHIAEKSNFGAVSLQKFNGYDRSNRGLQSAFQPIFDALYLKPFNLSFTHRKVLIVEGIYDFYSFDMFRRKRDYGIVPGKGASSLINLISLMIGFDVDFKVLWDKDGEGLKSMNDAIRYFGDEIASRHFAVLNSEKGKVILQNLYEGVDIKFLKKSLGLNEDAQFNKIVSSLYFNDNKEKILAEISSRTKQNFKEVLDSLGFE
jgi:predicted ATP-dependent endonuclease of OLD family